MNFDHEDTRCQLTATANKFGWKTKAGHRTATGEQKAHLEKAIRQQMAEIAALAA